MASTCSGVIETATVIRGYHVYKEIWTAPLGEILFCQRETDNRHDRFVVAIVKDSEVVGHVRREILSICSIFLLSETITCEVTGSRQYSYNLEQGGMDIPCKLKFTCSDQENLGYFTHCSCSATRLSMRSHVKQESIVVLDMSY